MAQSFGFWRIAPSSFVAVFVFYDSACNIIKQAKSEDRSKRRATLKSHAIFDGRDVALAKGMAQVA